MDPAAAPPQAPQVPVVDEPPRPSRVRRPSDLLRILLWGGVTAMTLLLASLAPSTISGIQTDLTAAADRLPLVALRILSGFSGLLLVAIPVSVLVVLAIRRQWVTQLEASLAGALAYGGALLFALRAPQFLPEDVLDALTTTSVSGQPTEAAVPLLAAIVAFVSVIGLRERPRLGVYAWASGLLFVVLAFAERSAAPLALLGSAAFGRVVGVVVRYAVGTANLRPPGSAIVDAMARVGIPLRSLRLRAEDGDVGRWYDGTTTDERPLRVLVLDRDRRAAGLPARLVRRIRLLGSAGRSEAWTVQGAVEQAVAPALAAAQGGVRVPRVLASCSVSPDASLLVYEATPHLRGLCDIEPGEVAPQVLDAAWRELAALHRTGISHGAVHAGAIAVDDDGEVWITDLQHGHLAAEPLAQRVDEAALLVATAAHVGVGPAVAAAARALGESGLGAVVPLVQPLALGTEARAAIRGRSGLLQSIREEALGLGAAEPESAVRLERVRVRTLAATAVLGVAVTLLLGQVGSIDLASLVRDVDWRWVAVGLVASFLTYVGAGANIQAFSPVRLRPLRTLAVQFASTIVALVTNPTLGIVANVRYITKAGTTPSLAAASFGVSGVFLVISYLVLLSTFAVLAGAPTEATFIPGRAVVLVIGAAVVIVSVALAVPPVRRTLVRRLGPVVAGTLPRLLEALRSPRRVALGFGGALLLNGAYAAALFASVHAYGVEISYPAAGFVFLAAGVLGNAAPTPGGIGAVEAAVAAALTVVGVPGAVAVQAALLYRVVTFWIPVGIGWLCMMHLQRTDVL